MNERILIIGTGNVGSHLAGAFRAKGISVTAVSSRVGSFPVADTDIVIIAVSDNAISGVASVLSRSITESVSGQPDRGYPLVAHTSGSIPLSVLTEALPEGTPCGVFYPMQTFTKGVEMEYSDIPFLIEGSDEKSAARLMRLAREVSGNVIPADSGVRADYHIGAVLTCNFANHLCALADGYLSSKGLDFRTLLPLLRQTLAKLENVAPRDAQTGPAARRDSNVIDMHLSKISDDPQLSSIYRLLSDSIRTTAEENRGEEK